MKYKNLKYSYNVIGFALIIFLAIREFATVIMQAIPFGENSTLKLVLWIVIFILSCLLPVIVMENMLGLHPKLFRKIKPEDAAASGGYNYLLICGAGIANGILLALLRRAGIDFAPATLNIPDGILNAVISFIYVCILPAVLEEIFVRGYILNALKPWGVTFAVAVSSVVFALMHSSLENFFMYFACGVILARAYLIFDSIFAPMVVHFINNSVSFFILAFRNRANAVSALSMVAFINIAVLILGIVGKKYMDKHGYNNIEVLKADGDILSKLSYMFKSTVFICGLALLLFFAAYASFDKMIK